MTTIQEALTQGLRMNLSTAGVTVTPSTGGSVVMLVNRAPSWMSDPAELPQAKTPIYTRLLCERGKVTSPRTVTTFTEKVSGKVHTVKRYEDDEFGVFDAWLCVRTF